MRQSRGRTARVPWPATRHRLRLHAVLSIEVHRTDDGSAGDVDGQGLLATAQGAEVRHWPVQSGKLKLSWQPNQWPAAGETSAFNVEAARIAASVKTG